MNFLKFFLFTTIVYFDVIKYYYLVVLYIIIRHINRYYIDRKLSDYKNINLICNYFINNKIYILLNKYFNIFINEVFIILYDLVNDCFNLILVEKLNNRIKFSKQENIKKLESKSDLISKLKINNNLDKSNIKFNNSNFIDNNKINKLSLDELNEVNNQLNLIKDNLKKII